MNARGIPAQSEDENLEKEYSYTINETTGEHVPYGQEPKHQPVTTPPSGYPSEQEKRAAVDTTDDNDSSVSQAKRQPRRQRPDEKSDEKSRESEKQ